MVRIVKEDKESKQIWETVGFVVEKVTLPQLILMANNNTYNSDEQFVFSVQWQFLPDKFQVGDEPLVSGVIWCKRRVSKYVEDKSAQNPYEEVKSNGTKRN